MNARFGHVNVIADDWLSLADFYIENFGCVPVPPERDYSGADLSRGTAVDNAALRGPPTSACRGLGPDGPTLEIYQYARNEPRGAAAAANRIGFGHIAFAVDDVPTARDNVIAAGGSSVGEVVTLQTSDGRRVTWCYVADPEGNFIELQAWSG